jgi:hypothetical protein
MRRAPRAKKRARARRLSLSEAKAVRAAVLRRTLSNEPEGKKYKKLWANELHPTDLGFKAVAAEFHKIIATLPLA